MAQGFTAVDPLAGQFPAYSPYNYTLNDPINKTDPDGRAPQATQCCTGTNPNVYFAVKLLEVQRTFGALADKVSATVFGRYNTGTVTVGSGNASATVEAGVEVSVTARPALAKFFTFTPDAKPTPNLVTVTASINSRTAAAAKVPVGPGNVGVVESTSTKNGTTAHSTEANAGASAGGTSAKAYVKQTTTGGQTITQAGAEVKVTTPTVLGQNLSAGGRVNVDLE